MPEPNSHHNPITIYYEARHHGEAVIAGTQESLFRLTQVIMQALTNQEGHCIMVAYPNDGEGYRLHVVRVDDEEYDRLANPYLEAVCVPMDHMGMQPMDIVKARIQKENTHANA